jgi:hypothetical protein
MHDLLEGRMVACVRWERRELLHLDAKLDNGAWMVVKRRTTSVAAATESLILNSVVGCDGRDGTEVSRGSTERQQLP